MKNDIVLIIDDEQDIRELASDILEEEGFNCITAADSMEAFDSINKKLPNVVLLDIWLQGSELDGLGILEILKQKHPQLPVIMISGHGTIETAVNSIKLGAYDYLEKPFTSDKLIITVKRAVEAFRLKKENSELRKKIVNKLEFIGNSQVTIQLKTLIEKIAPTSSRIIITGQPGSGKELIARIIHKKSKRALAPFVTLNTSLLNDENYNQELFGDFNQGSSSKYNMGIFELADKGTLYIDEVADMPISAQKKILKFLKEQSIEKSNTTDKADVRIIASTNKNLAEEVKSGRFLQELYYRLNVISVQVPTLKERKDDIPILAEYFLKHFERTSGFAKKTLLQDTITALQAYSWPGNIRQLRNTIEWLLIMTSNESSDTISPEALPHDILTQKVSKISSSEIDTDVLSLPLREAREIFEKQYLAAQMLKFNNNISKTALFVGMERSALHRKLKLLNIHSSNSEDEKELIEIELTDA